MTAGRLLPFGEDCARMAPAARRLTYYSCRGCPIFSLSPLDRQPEISVSPAARRRSRCSADRRRDRRRLDSLRRGLRGGGAHRIRRAGGQSPATPARGLFRVGAFLVPVLGDGRGYRRARAGAAPALAGALRPGLGLAGPLAPGFSSPRARSGEGRWRRAQPGGRVADRARCGITRIDIGSARSRLRFAGDSAARGAASGAAGRAAVDDRGRRL